MCHFLYDYFYFSLNFSLIQELVAQSILELWSSLCLQGKGFPSINFISFYFNIFQTQLNSLLRFAQ